MTIRIPVWLLLVTLFALGLGLFAQAMYFGPLLHADNAPVELHMWRNLSVMGAFVGVGICVVTILGFIECADKGTLG